MQGRTKKSKPKRTGANPGDVERAIAHLRAAAKLLRPTPTRETIIIPAIVQPVRLTPDKFPRGDRARYYVGKALGWWGGADEGNKVRLSDIGEAVQFLADMVE